jgi:hypothetical protein
MRIENKTLRIIYILSIRLPLMFLGYLKDQIALKRELTDPVFNDLKRDGIHKFPEPLSAADIRDLLRDFEALKILKPPEKEGQLSGRIYAEGILSPLLKKYADKVGPHVAMFFNTENFKVEISYYQESYPQANVDSIPGGDFHVDDNKANLKYFIYLSDVGEKNGPFSCVPSTGSWRLRWSFIRGVLWELTGNRRYHYAYLLDRKKNIANEKAITGRSGTNFLVDTTSLHRAWPLINGCRKVSVISFNRASKI